MSITIHFRTADIRWGAGVGSNLTPSQVDENFYNLVQAIQGISVTASVSIASITQPTATTLLVNMSDGSTQGPFDLPTTTWNARGAWAATTAYIVGDIVSNGSTIYIVMVDHTSLGTFSAGYTIGGDLVYSAMMTMPSELPAAGSTGQVLAKASGTDYDVAWDDTHYVPAGGNTSQSLVKLSSTDYDVDWATISSVPTGGSTSQSLVKVSSADFDVSWSTIHELISGGTTNQVLAKASNTDYDVAWQTATSGLPTGGSAGNALIKNSGTDYDVTWQTLVPTGGATGYVLAKASATNYDTTWIPAPVSLPSLGTTGQALVKNSNTNYDVTWETFASLPIGGSTGQVLKKNSATLYDASWATLSIPVAINDVASQFADYTVALTDLPKRQDIYVYGGNLNVTLPQYSSVAFAIGDRIEFIQRGDGTTTFLAGSGVTIWKPEGRAAKIGRIYGWACAVKIDNTTWAIYGDLAQDSSAATVSSSPYAITSSMSDDIALTIGATATLNYATPPKDGRPLTIRLISDGTGRTVTFGTNLNSTGTLTTSATTGQTNIVLFIHSAGNAYYEASRTTAM